MVTDEQIAASIDLDNPNYLEITLYDPADFNAYLSYFQTNKIPYTPDWLRTVILIRNNAGNNTRRIYLIPQGQFLF